MPPGLTPWDLLQHITESNRTQADLHRDFTNRVVNELQSIKHEIKQIDDRIDDLQTLVSHANDKADHLIEMQSTEQLTLGLLPHNTAVEVKNTVQSELSNALTQFQLRFSDTVTRTRDVALQASPSGKHNIVSDEVPFLEVTKDRTSLSNKALAYFVKSLPYIFATGGIIWAAIERWVHHHQ